MPRQLLGPRKINGKKFVCTDIFYKKRPAKKYAKEMRRAGISARVISSVPKSKRKVPVYGVYFPLGKARGRISEIH